MEYIAVLDCNNFFVSCERLFRPDLATQPVVVLSSNDGCVVARSQEIKDMGIPMGVPVFQIKDIIKDNGIICFSSNFTLYRDVSARVFATLRECCGEMEQYSIDEAFFRVTAVSDAEAEAQVRAIKTVVETAVGIPVSIGVSETKTRAKQANAYAKKHGGIAVVSGDDFLSRYGAEALSSVWGIGRQSAIKYQAGKLHTIADFVTADVTYVQGIGHVPGRQVQAELRGMVVHALGQGRAIPQSIMSTRSFAKKTNELGVIEDALAHHVRQVCADMRSQGLVATSINVLLLTSRHGDWRFYSGSKTVDFTIPTASTMVCLKATLEAIRALHEPGVPYSKVGVVATGLIPAAYVSGSLFVDAGATKSTLDTVVDSLNARFGHEMVRQGAFTNDDSWRSKSTLRSPAYTTDWSSLKSVSAKDR